ncbi:MAG: DUF4437 domain-containing protein [Myxococcota bacterium]
MDSRLCILAIVLAACGGPAAPTAPTPTTHTVRPSAELTWQALNPARGEASPRAADLWGDRTEEGATGFLVRFVDGFASPPHIHNVTYRAVVLSGLVYNGDPDGEPEWMPPGSFWTQPKGGAHITAARGDDVVAYVEIDEGPYLVQPVAEAFDDGTTPRNVPAARLPWREAGAGRVALLWENGEHAGHMVALSGGATATLRAASAHAVVVLGGVAVRWGEGDRTESIDPGSHVAWTGEGPSATCANGEGCTLYVRSSGELTLE